MNSLSTYLDKVKAEEKLKEKTESYVRAALSSAVYQNKIASTESQSKKIRPTVRKLFVAMSSIAACLLLALGGNAYYHKPVSYVCVDINPSVELGINVFDRVVSAQAYNEDGRQLIEGQTYENISLEDALSMLVQAAAAQGFIFEDGTTIIALTAESDNSAVAEELRDSCEADVNSALSAAGIHAVVFSDNTDLQLREQAKDAGISPGKLRLIRILQALAPNITVDEYQNAKITDILTRANVLLSQPENAGWQNGKDAAALERIRGAAAQVQSVYTNTERAQTGSPQQEPNGNMQQTQNQGTNVPPQNQPQNNQSSGGTVQGESQNQSYSETGIPNSEAASGQQEEQPQTQGQNQGETSVSSPLPGQSSGTQAEAGEAAQGNEDKSASNPVNGGATDPDRSPLGGQSGSGKGGG